MGSAIATAAAVNDVADETGVTAIVNETRVVGSDTTTDATVAANSVAGGGVDMNPTGKPKKMDKRSRFSVEKMYRRAMGTK